VRLARRSDEELGEIEQGFSELRSELDEDE